MQSLVRGMSSQRGHRPNGDFQTDEEMMRDKLVQILGALTLTLGAAFVLAATGNLPV